MKYMVYVFAAILVPFVVFFGWISISILVRNKPVIIKSNRISILLAFMLIPISMINLFNGSIRVLGIWAFLSPITFLFILVFYAFILRGFSVYGISIEDFRKGMAAALDNIGIKYIEEIGKFRLPELDTEVTVNFQENLGTGIIRSKNKEKFNISYLKKAFSTAINVNVVKTMKITGYFYIGFTLLMLCTICFLLWLLITKTL